MVQEKAVAYLAIGTFLIIIGLVIFYIGFEEVASANKYLIFASEVQRSIQTGQLEEGAGGTLSALGAALLIYGLAKK